jgi:hypothetical protein
VGVIRLGKDVTVEVVGAVVVVVVAHGAGLDGEVWPKVGVALHGTAEATETAAPGLKKGRFFIPKYQYYTTTKTAKEY